MDASSDFIAKFRATLANNGMQASKLPTRRDMVMDNRREAELKRKERKAREEHERARQEWVDKQAKETAPLRDAISQATDGRVTVDDSIYNKDALERILGTVTKMRDFNNGALPLGYTVLSDGPSLFGTNTEGMMYSSNDGGVYDGTKNKPFSIIIKNANYPEENDYIGFEQMFSDWWAGPKNRGEETESPVLTHELSHVAHRTASKKVPRDPNLTSNFTERFYSQDFRDTHPPIYQLFEKAAKNVGYDNIKDAAATISGYANSDAKDESEQGDNPRTDWGDLAGFRFTDVFAEAYTDVLYNGDSAQPYSKELVKLVSEYSSDYDNSPLSKRFIQDNGLLNLPRTNNQSEFINNLRKMYFGPKS